MTKNPEFIRNLWLIHSPLGLITRPFLITAVFFLIYFGLADGSELFVHRPEWEAYAFGLFGFFTILGGFISSASILVEIQGKTWDGQRMSAIPPWSMAWGKLFGSTAYIWYSGLICILLYAYAGHLQSMPAAVVFKNIVVWILAGVTAQAALTLTTLINLLKAPITERASGGSFAMLFTMVLGVGAIPALWLVLPPEGTVNWYGWQFDLLDFLMLSAAAFAAWAVAGVYFTMRREFQYTNNPLIWLAFVIFALIFAAGFQPGYKDPLMAISLGRATLDRLLPVYVAVLLVYAIALADRTDWRIARGLGRSIADRNWREAFNLTPKAVLTFIVLAIVVGWAAIFGDDSPVSLALGWTFRDKTLIALALLVARDVGLILYFGFAYSPDPENMKAIGCILLLTGIVPLVAFFFATPVVLLFWPLPSGIAVLSLFVQALVVWFLVGHRIRAAHTTQL